MPRRLNTLDESFLFAHPDGPIALFEVTLSVADRRCLLRPDARCVALIDGVIGRAQALFDFELYAYEWLSTHGHLFIGVRDLATKARVMQHIGTNISKEINRLRKRSGPVFAGRCRAIQIADEATAVARLKYVIGQATAAQVVARPVETPFASANPTLLSGRPIVGAWVDRDAMYQAGAPASAEEDFTEWYTIEIAQLPHLVGAPEDYRALCRRLADEVAEEARTERAATGKRLQSAEVARALAPTRRIETPRRVLADDGRMVAAKQSPAPALHGPATALEAWRARYRALREAVTRATAAWRAYLSGSTDRPKRYPPGALPPGGFGQAALRCGD